MSADRETQHERTWEIEEEHEPREAREPSGPVQLCGDGRRQREEAAAHEPVQDAERHLWSHTTATSDERT